MELSGLEIVILSVLTRERYGLEIKHAIERATDGGKTIPIGSLYTTLDRMVKKGLVSKRSGNENGARRLYVPTRAGVAAFNEERRNLLKLFDEFDAPSSRPRTRVGIVYRTPTFRDYPYYLATSAGSE